MSLEQTFERSRDVVIAMDASGQVTYCNPAAEALPAEQRAVCEAAMRAGQVTFEWSAGVARYHAAQARGTVSATGALDGGATFRVTVPGLSG